MNVHKRCASQCYLNIVKTRTTYMSIKWDCEIIMCIEVRILENVPIIRVKKITTVIENDPIFQNMLGRIHSRVTTVSVLWF